jgi:hypothetical protein
MGSKDEEEWMNERERRVSESTVNEIRVSELGALTLYFHPFKLQPRNVAVVEE